MQSRRSGRDGFVTIMRHVIDFLFFDPVDI
jgi:hypothetical protein